MSRAILAALLLAVFIPGRAVLAEEPTYERNEFVLAPEEGSFAELPTLDLSPLGKYGYSVELSDGLLKVRASRTEADLEVDGTAAMTRRVRELCSHVELLNPGILCDPNQQFSLAATPNDPSLGLLYGLTKIEAPTAWNTAVGSSNVTVAVIDTGINYLHADLAANASVNPGEVAGNGIDDDNNGFVDDVYGYDFVNKDGNPADDHFHGTHCAGTIGAVGNNGIGISGVAWAVKLLGVKVLGADGSGSLATVAQGVNYARTRGADVINLSLGGSSLSDVLEKSLRDASDAGIFISVAAGNSARNNDVSSTIPANYSFNSQVSVAATDSNDALASFSNYGATKVHLGAPGVNILSTYFTGGYAYASGTSMAAPHVAGAAAVLKGFNPSLTGAQIKDLLLNNVTAVSALAGKSVTGGRLNLAAALSNASQVTPTPTLSPTAPPTAAPTEPGAEPPTATPTPSVTPTPIGDDQTPIPTSTPTPLPTQTPTPQPTATPMPPNDGDEGDAETAEITISVSKLTKAGRATLRATVVGSESGEPFEDERVAFLCGKKFLAWRTTNALGRASVIALFRKGVTTCRAALPDGTFSAPVVIRRR